MKKFIFALFIILSITATAQIPERWYTLSITIVLNPSTDGEISKTRTCLSEFEWDGKYLTIEDCDDNNYKLMKLGEPNYNREKNYYHWMSYEQSSGNSWLIIFYLDDYSTSLFLSDQSTLIVYD
jgi:hypothetical protein